MVKRMPDTRVADAEGIRRQGDDQTAAVGVVDEGILQQVGHEGHGERLVEDKRQPRLFTDADGNVPVFINLAVVIQVAAHNVVEADGTDVSKLLVLDFRQQQERLVELRDVLQGLVCLCQLLQLSP